MRKENERKIQKKQKNDEMIFINVRTKRKKKKPRWLGECDMRMN